MFLKKFHANNLKGQHYLQTTVILMALLPPVLFKLAILAQVVIATPQLKHIAIKQELIATNPVIKFTQFATP